MIFRLFKTAIGTSSSPGSTIIIIITVIVVSCTAAVPSLGQDENTNKTRNNERKENLADIHFNLGISLHYTWWNPVWGKVSQAGDMFFYMLLNQAVPFLKIESPSRVYEVDPAFMGGLHFYTGFEKSWGMSADLVIGGYRDASVMVTALTTNPFDLSEYTKYRIDSITFDSALLAHYRIASWFALSIGPAYQGYTLKEKNTSYLFSFSRSGMMHLFGGKVGADFTVPLVENLSIEPALSFLTLHGIADGGFISSGSIALGGTASVPFKYYLEKIHITITLGFKYQFLYYMQVGHTDYINRWDHRYGLFESITYTF